MALNHLLGIFQVIRRGTDDSYALLIEFIKVALKIS